MSTLYKEVWVGQLLKNFYPDSSFLNHVKDFSSLVDNNAINMAEVGVDPNVLVNNTTYPIKVVQRIDNPIRIELDLFETENTLVRRPEAIEYSYDQLESVLMGHRSTLRAKTAEKAAHAYAPLENSEYTPVVSTSGNTSGTRKSLSVVDILTLKECFDDMCIPFEDRFLVLNPKHISDLILFDIKAFKDLTDIVEGKPKRFAGFNILQTSITPKYNAETLKKKSFTDEEMETDTFCSFAFHKDEVMKADGDTFLYSKENDPEERGTIIGFDKRFIALPIRDKALGAIVSTKVP